MKTNHEIYYDKERTRPLTNYQIDKYGYAILNTGRFYVFGETRCMAYGDSILYAFDNSTVDASDNSTVYASDNSTVYAGDNSTVYNYDDSTVMVYTAWDYDDLEDTFTSTYDNTKIIDMRNKDEKRK